VTVSAVIISVHIREKGLKMKRRIKDMNLTAEILRETLSYDKDTGIFMRIKSRFKDRYKGVESGYIRNDGYRCITINTYPYLAHRLAWLYMTGKFPEHQIDHIDHDRSNNAWNNLRDATRAENARNCSISKNNKSGVNGVYWRANKWEASIMVNRKTINLGRFVNLEDAKKARAEADMKYNFHNNHGNKSNS